MAIAETFPTAAASRLRSTSLPRRARATRAERPVRPTRVTSPRAWRLTRRGRVVVGVVVSVPFAALLVLLGSVSADAGTPGSVSAPATSVVVVQPGESLWQIAQDVAPQADPRATITTIRELNGLAEGTVVPGQSIIVPTSF